MSYAITSIALTISPPVQTCHLLSQLIVPTHPILTSLSNIGQSRQVGNYSKTCVKRPLKNRQNKGLNDK